jgi:hypothetical protein
MNKIDEGRRCARCQQPMPEVNEFADMHDPVRCVELLQERMAEERIAFMDKISDQSKAIENREARLKAAESKLSSCEKERDDYRTALRTIADENGAKIIALETRLQEIRNAWNTMKESEVRIQVQVPK